MLVVKDEDCTYEGFDGERHSVYIKQYDSYQLVRRFKMILKTGEVVVYEADGTKHLSSATLRRRANGN